MTKTTERNQVASVLHNLGSGFNPDIQKAILDIDQKLLDANIVPIVTRSHGFADCGQATALEEETLSILVAQNGTAPKTVAYFTHHNFLPGDVYQDIARPVLEQLEPRLAHLDFDEDK